MSKNRQRIETSFYLGIKNGIAFAKKFTKATPKSAIKAANKFAKNNIQRAGFLEGFNRYRIPGFIQLKRQILHARSHDPLAHDHSLYPAIAGKL